MAKGTSANADYIASCSIWEHHPKVMASHPSVIVGALAAHANNIRYARERDREEKTMHDWSLTWKHHPQVTKNRKSEAYSLLLGKIGVLCQPKAQATLASAQTAGTQRHQQVPLLEQDGGILQADKAKPAASDDPHRLTHEEEIVEQAGQAALVAQAAGIEHELSPNTPPAVDIISAETQLEKVTPAAPAVDVPQADKEHYANVQVVKKVTYEEEISPQTGHIAPVAQAARAEHECVLDTAVCEATDADKVKP